MSKIDQKVMAEGVRLGQEASNLRRQRVGKGQKKFANKEKIRIQKRARQVLRCGIARHLTGDAYREFSCRLTEALSMEQYFVDTTCLKANIHFALDWVLLRDGT